MDKLKIGIIGIGRIGRIHLDNLTKHFREVEVIAACDISSAGRDYALNAGVGKVYENAKEILSHTAVDTVVICSSTDTHPAYVIEAARNGKAVFCEKPLGLSISTILEVLDSVKEHNVPLMVAFNRRFDANFKKVRDIVRSGKIGDPHIIKITSRDSEPPPLDYIKTSGGMFLDMTVHDFDMARFILGSEVNEVYAKASVLVDDKIGAAGDIDTAIITLTFDNGAIGVIDNSRKAVYGYDQRVEVFGSKGMVNIDNNRSDTHVYYGDKSISQSLPLNFFIDRYLDSYFNEMNEFIDALINKKPIPVSGSDGLKSLAIGLCASKSLRENRPVKMKEYLIDYDRVNELI